VTKLADLLGIQIPKQHGAWSILGVSFLLGTFIEGPFRGRSLILLLSLLTGFVGWETYNAALRAKISMNARAKRLLRSSLALLGFSLISGLWLVFSHRLYGLVPLAGIMLALSGLALLLERRRKARTFFGEIIGILGLSMIVPGAAYCVSGEFSSRTVGLWALCAAFFAGSLFHVRFLVRNRQERAQRFMARVRAAVPSLACHGMIGAGALFLSATLEEFPRYAVVAVAPMIVKAFWAPCHRAEGPLPIRQIGYIELTHAILFSILTLVIYKIQ
jgi:hypothetical protein